MRSRSTKIPNLSESLEEKLEELIFGGAFWPDKSLASERRLSNELGVSRTSLRNALDSLREKGLLTQNGKRFFVTNIMAELLMPGLKNVKQHKPGHLLDYWLIFLAEVLLVSRKNSQNSDRVNIQSASRAFSTHIANNDAEGAFRAFDNLIRSIMDGCYSFFLSQTDFSLREVMKSQFLDACYAIVDCDERGQVALKTASDLAALQVDADSLRFLFGPHTASVFEGNLKIPAPSWPAQSDNLLKVVSQHPRALEGIYELRLITEKHATAQAAAHATPLQFAELQAQLARMLSVVDVSPSGYSKLDTALHKMIASCAHNSVFTLLDDALAPVFSKTTNTWLKRHMELGHDQSEIHLQHTLIVDAISKNDVAAATKAIEEHLAYVLRNLRFLREQDRLQRIAIARRKLGQP